MIMKSMCLPDRQNNVIKEKNPNEMNVRGTEALVLVSVVIGLLVLSLLTTITSLFIIAKLRLVPGAESITFDKDSNIVFHGETDLDRVHLYKNVIRDVNTISGDVQMEAGDSYLNINAKGIEVGSPEGFQVFSTTGKKIFPPDFASMSLPSKLSSLTVPAGAHNVHKVRSPIDKDLNISAKERIRIKGNEGVTIDGRTINLSSNGMFLASVNGTIILEGGSGISLGLDANDVYPRRDDDERPMAMQYKLCICARTGRVFKLHLKSAQNTCADVRFPESINPCV